MNLAEMLEECVARWDWPEGKLGAMQARMRRHRDFNADCAGDAVPPDRITDYRRLLETGRVVFGAVVQASADLYSAGAQDLPAYVVYGLTPYFATRPQALPNIAGRLFALREESLDDEDERAPLAASLKDGGTPPQQMPVPLSVSAGHTGAFLGSLVVHRRRLPTGWLTQPVLPIVACPERTKTVMVLPLRYWSPNLVRLWREEEIASTGKAGGGVRVTGLAGLMLAPEPLSPAITAGEMTVEMEAPPPPASSQTSSPAP